MLPCRFLVLAGLPTCRTTRPLVCAFHVGGWRQRVGLPLSNAATVILCVATFAWSCGGGKSNSPTSPTTDVHIAGTWTGTFTSSVIGLSQPASATLSQSGSSVNGTITCSGGPCLFSSASISGNVTGTTVTAQANYPGGAFYSAGSCTYNGTVSSSATPNGRHLQLH